MKQHYIHFLCPGTLVSECIIEKIDSWDVEIAKQLATKQLARHASKPYGFRFVTKERTENELDSKVVKTSPMYFLGGKVETLDEVRARNDPKEKTLLWNMEVNNFNRIITNTNSWEITLPLADDDVVLE